MPGNKAVVYQGPGRVSVESVDYPELVLKPGPGVPKANANRAVPARRHPQGGVEQHLRQRPAHGARPDDGAAGADPRP